MRIVAVARGASTTFNARLTPILAPTPTPAPPPIVVTDLTGPKKIKNGANATYTYSLKVEGGTPPYTYSWLARGTVLAEGAGDDFATQRFTQQQVMLGSTGDTAWISVYVRDSAGDSPRWTTDEGKGSSEFMYGVQYNPDPKHQQVIQLPEYPYCGYTGTGDCAQ